DPDVRKEAGEKLEALGEDALPALRRAGKAHADVDVRLRADVVAAAIEKKAFGEVRRFTGHADGVTVMALSPDARRVATGAGPNWKDPVVRVWDVATGKQVGKLELRDVVIHALAWAPDGKRLISGSTDKLLRVWDVGTGKELKSLAGSQGHVLGVAPTPD